MNIKASYRYQLSDVSKPIFLYYIIVLLVYAALFITLSINHSESGSPYVSGQFNGIEAATAIFLFIMGLCSFKEAFGMMMQNGISRKTIFIGKIITSLTAALAMAFIDQLLTFVFKAFSGFTHNALNYQSLYEQLYVSNATDRDSISLALSNIVFAFLLYLGITTFGYLITLAFYRMNKAGKIIVGVGVPVGLFTVLPIIDYSLTGGRISTAINNFIIFAFGTATGQPLNAFITCILVFLLFNFFIWLMLRRASVRV